MVWRRRLVSYLLALDPVRFRNHFGLVSEEVIVVQVEQSSEACHGGFVIFETGVPEDMFHRETGLVKIPGNQDRSVTRKGLPFGTHESDLVFLNASPDARKALFEAFRLSQSIVLNLAIDVATRIICSRTQFFTEVRIGDSGDFERIRQRLAIELGISVAIWVGTDICDGCDPMGTERREKRLEALVRMSDGIDSVWHSSRLTG